MLWLEIECRNADSLTVFRAVNEFTMHFTPLQYDNTVAVISRVAYTRILYSESSEDH